MKVFTQRIICLWLLLLINSLLFAQGSELIPFRKGGMWGFSTIEKKIVIIPQYHEVMPFQDGLAIVENASGRGLIDKTGNLVVPIGTYHNILPPAEKMYSVVKNDKWGFLNQNGKQVVDCEYDNVSDYSESLARIEKDGKVGFIDDTGKLINPLNYEQASPFHEGFAAVRKNKKWGFIDKLGQNLTQMAYDTVVESFREGIAIVKKLGRQIVINKQGKEVLLNACSGLPHEGIFKCSKNGKYGFIRADNTPIGGFVYDETTHFINGFAAVKKQQFWGFIDKSGKEVVPCKYQEVEFFVDGFAKVKSNGLWGVVERYGNEVVSCKYENVGIPHEKMVAIEKGGKWGFIDLNGNETVPAKYLSCSPFHGSVAAVSIENNKIYLIDKIGKNVNSHEYEWVSYESNNIHLVYVKKNGKYGYVSDEGVEFWDDSN